MAEGGNKFNIFAFLFILVLPSGLGLLALMEGEGNDYGIMSGFVLLCGSLVAGPACGTYFAMTLKQVRGWKRVLIGVGMSIGCAVLAFALGIGGCTVVIEFGLAW